MALGASRVSLGEHLESISLEEFRVVWPASFVSGVDLGRKTVASGKCHDRTELLIEQKQSIALEEFGASWEGRRMMPVMRV